MELFRFLPLFFLSGAFGFSLFTHGKSKVVFVIAEREYQTEKTLPEFILYWQENGSAQCSWSTKFLQYVKRQWAYQSKLVMENSNGKQQRHSKGRIRDRSIIEKLSDRSWAS